MAALNSSRLTDEQRCAIERRNVSIALSAGAGCGKTHVLVERLLAELAPGSVADNDSAARLAGVVAITFTDRAAREMRDRLRRKCRERLHAANERDADAWAELLRGLETARISTIHAFCGGLLRANAVEAGVDPHFRILQPGQSATLFFEQVDDQLRRLLGDMNEDLLSLTVMFGLPALRGMLQHLLGRRHAIDFDLWAQLTPADLVKRWQVVEREEVVPRLREEFSRLPEVAVLCKIVNHWQPEHPKLRQRFAILQSQLAAFDEAEFLPALDAIRKSATVQHVTSRIHWHSDETYADFRDAAEAVRDWIDDAKKRLGIELQAALPSAAAGLALLRVARPMIEAYEGRKRELGMLDFDDLLVRATRLLEGNPGAPLRDSLSSQIKLLLVDEFQDTDPVQVELVKILCGDQLHRGKLFFVGDAKQSIYRFRGADPAVFHRLQQEVPEPGRLPLRRNFRSQPGVLEFVNALFCHHLEGNDYQALVPHRPAMSPAPVVEFLWAKTPADDLERPSVEALRRAEADWIARRLAQLFASDDSIVSDKTSGKARQATPGDVAILFRALSDVRYYEEALRRHGIPYYLVGGGAYYAQQEIFDLLNLLRALDSPEDTVSLAGVLRSPFFSLTDNTLYWLGRHERGLAAGLFAERLPLELSPEERERADFAAATLRELRERKDRLPVAALIREALSRTGYDALLLAEFLGERKLANLRKLIDQARSFDESGVFTLSDYIHELHEFVSRQPEEPPAPVELETSTVVRLMTIHQSKGLEFPIVVVPDLTRNQRGPQATVAFDQHMGPLLRAKDGLEASRCGLDLWRYLQEQEEVEEGIRLLYVATTRAAEYLILSAGVADFDKPTGWLEFLAESFDLRTGEYRAQLPAAYARPHVTVTLLQPPAPAREITSDWSDWRSTIHESRERAATGRGVIPRLVAPVPAESAARRTLSFSRLSADFEPERIPDQEKPLFETLGKEPSGDATNFGSLVHAVLAKVDLANPRDVLKCCQKEIARRFSTSDASLSTAASMLERFLHSPRAAAIREARVVHRELDFMLRWPKGDADNPLIQGTIDCLYQASDGAWHVLDYKTNAITAESVPRVAAKYEMQLGLYALAVEEILGVSPTSLRLYFLRPGVEFETPWNDASRARIIDWLDEATRNSLIR